MSCEKFQICGEIFKISKEYFKNWHVSYLFISLFKNDSNLSNQFFLAIHSTLFQVPI